ncbi:hypothetical protein C1Y08_24325 [Pseudomonas sp. FW306-02-F02-AA]|nr:hypothetical protein C1Y07_23765 [Pseudomonas sp. FW306-02-F02-AB]PMZ07599.1 hypothetical protein C1Y06_23720 [Pseudomonas sp. FW306-02-H06C]PMZ13317.1 hypothetical protein C1Y08_24325 [Pseudomonas sp. FW306-02-F02-AA]PMZ19361.1 hypothetical protein C1Y09_24390 [Pseudomonas sp. FW306-02-F08-AA]PMZ29329.1 hypothetical protein C1Y05_01900 [Pseudomonas sp. FW306-02-F04-BA]PMZ31894.1 hypothetical protein C1X99_24095 [Pseudomonas sp. FW306-02-H06B]PMZ37750.1 hypothetical protein C1Y00_25365 [Ps
MVELATIRNRGPAVNKGRWEAQILRKGYPAQRKTFETKAFASWALFIEKPPFCSKGCVQ